MLREEVQSGWLFCSAKSPDRAFWFTKGRYQMVSDPSPNTQREGEGETIQKGRIEEEKVKLFFKAK